MIADLFSFPDWVEEFQLNDNVFADAYEATPPEQRAWMKKTIAQIYGVSSPDSPQSSWTINTWKGGFETETASSVLDCVVMLLDQGSTSPVRILSALTPALAVGIKNVIVVFVGEGEISQSVLTGFELAGQELVVSLSDDKLSELVSHICDSKVSSAILDLRSCPDEIAYSEYINYWRAPKILSISVCADDDGPDMDIVKFAHPDVVIKSISIEDFTDSVGDAIIVPAELVGEALVDYKIVLSHGQEGCWIWNNLPSSFFRKASVALAMCS